jgi:hypothetical protein
MFLPCLEIYPLCPTLWASATNYYLTRAFKISKYFLHWPGRLVMLGCSAVGIEPQKKPSRLTSRKRERSLEPVGVIHSIVPMQMSRHIGVRWSSTERFRTTTVYSFGRRLRPYNVAYLCVNTILLQVSFMSSQCTQTVMVWISRLIVVFTPAHPKFRILKLRKKNTKQRGWGRSERSQNHSWVTWARKVCLRIGKKIKRASRPYT